MSRKYGSHWIVTGVVDISLKFVKSNRAIVYEIEAFEDDNRNQKNIKFHSTYGHWTPPGVIW